MVRGAGAIARDLAGQAERVCRTYLSNGHREGAYWLVGDVRNAPGRSLYVRLRPTAEGMGVPGKWTDAQSGEHGDLLDIIRAAMPGGTLAEALADAHRLLSLPDTDKPSVGNARTRADRGSPDAARRLIAITRPIAGSPVTAYLSGRGIRPEVAGDTLRFHPRCWYRRSREDRADVPAALPAMIAAVTDNAGVVTGAHRTWLAPGGGDKASVAIPRRAMGALLGSAVRFGKAAPVMVAGEGIETMLSVRTALPALPAIAALSAAHLGAFRFPPILRRLYVAREPDPAGYAAFRTLQRRAAEAGIDLHPLDCEGEDFNADLQALGVGPLAERLLGQMQRDDASQLLASAG